MNHTISPERTALARIAEIYGNDTAFVQGTGGNISIKDREGFLHIKASGFQLNAVTETAGCAEMNLFELTAWLEKERMTPGTAHEHDARMSEFFRTATRNGEKPSMETIMHMIPVAIIVHVHLVTALVLLCAYEGGVELQKLFGDEAVVGISYVSPGFLLGEAVYGAYERFFMSHGHYPEIFFLRNHGITVAADTPERVQELLNLVHERCRGFLEERGVNYQEYMANSMAIMPHEALFPDAAVFMKKPVSSAARENFKVQDAVVRMVKAVKLTPAFLSEGEVKNLQGFQSEQHRQTISV